MSLTINEWFNLPDDEPPVTATTKIKNLQREIHRDNEIKGWHAEPLRDDNGSMIPDRVITKLALIHTELGEADIEEHHDRLGAWYDCTGRGDCSKPEGYVIELSDALIRALDLCEQLGVTIDPDRESEVIGDDRLSLRTIVDAAIEAVRIGRIGIVRDAMSALWVDAHWEAHKRGLDLDAAIRTKIEYNRTRTFRHGGKLA